MIAVPESVGSANWGYANRRSAICCGRSPAMPLDVGCGRELDNLLV